MSEVPFEQIFRGRHARVLATLMRQFGDLELAEDALQEACARALSVWCGRGLLEQPARWLIEVARRVALDRQRRPPTLPLDGADGERAVAADPANDAALHSAVGDDRLRLLLTCCRPRAPIRCAARSDEAREAYHQALLLVRNPVERQYLQRRLEALPPLP